MDTRIVLKWDLEHPFGMDGADSHTAGAFNAIALEIERDLSVTKTKRQRRAGARGAPEGNRKR